MAQGDANEVVINSKSLLDELTAMRKYAIDEAGMPIYRWRQNASMLNSVLYEKMRKLPKSDRKFTHFEQKEGLFEFTDIVEVDATHVDVVNADAKWWQPNTRFVNPYINYDSTSGYSAVTSPTVATVYHPEEILVTANSGDDSGAAAGYARITIVRAHTLMGGASTGISNWKAGQKPMRVNRTNKDGGSSGVAVTQNALQDFNYLEIMEWPYAVTEGEQAVKKFSIENPLAWQFTLASRDMVLQMERKMLLYGQGYARMTSDGLAEHSTRSVAGYITSSNVLPIAEKTVAALDAALKPLSLKGTSTRRYIHCGADFFLSFKNVFTPFVQVSELSGDRRFGMKVVEYMDGVGVSYVLMLSKVMSEDPSFKYAGIVCNYEYMDYCYEPGKDLYVDKGKDGTGLQLPDVKQTKEQLRAIVGLRIANPEAHGIIYFA